MHEDGGGLMKIKNESRLRRLGSLLGVVSLALSCASFSYSQSEKAVQAAPPTPPALLMGAAWYPEQWPESRWEADLDLMQKAHLHMVRLGEYTWSRIEPQEGQYDFDWLE